MSEQEPRGFIRMSPYTGYWLPGWGADGFSLRRYLHERYGTRLMWLAWGAALVGGVGLAVIKGMV